MKAFDVRLFDRRRPLAESAARTLGLSVAPRLSQEVIESCQCAVVCSPTSSHSAYLRRFLDQDTPVVVCEKPVCVTREEAKQLERLRRKSSSRVLVNYSRRFLPAYAALAQKVKSLLSSDSLRLCEVRYQRGFLNNASHALDLLQFFTGWNIATARVRVLHSEKDEFPRDPTISCAGMWNGAQLSIVGLPRVEFSLFEIDLFFGRKAIRLRDRGDTIEFAEPGGARSGYHGPLVTRKTSRGNLEDSFKNLYRQVQRMLRNPSEPDNFAQSIELARWMAGVLSRV
jgi:hypothetical protein